MSVCIGNMKDGFGEVVVARDMPAPCKFLSLDCRQKFPVDPQGSTRGKTQINSHYYLNFISLKAFDLGYHRGKLLKDLPISSIKNVHIH